MIEDIDQPPEPAEPSVRNGFLDAMNGIRGQLHADVLTAARAVADLLRQELGQQIAELAADVRLLRESSEEMLAQLADLDASMDELKADLADVAGHLDEVDRREQAELAKMLSSFSEAAKALAGTADRMVSPNIKLEMPARRMTKSIIYGAGGFPSQIIEDEQPSTGDKNNGE
jgi:chromosome segregation ATPase